jgi:hypothetical protein
MTTANESTPEDEVTTRPFADILMALNRGKTHAELSRQMQQLVAAVQETGKKGQISLTIAISPTKSDGVLEVIDTVAVKAPTHTRAASLFYADDDANLVREDPRQQTLWPPAEITADPADRSRKAQ